MVRHPGGSSLSLSPSSLNLNLPLFFHFHPLKITNSLIYVFSHQVNFCLSLLCLNLTNMVSFPHIFNIMTFWQNPLWPPPTHVRVSTKAPSVQLKTAHSDVQVNSRKGSTVRLQFWGCFIRGTCIIYILYILWNFIRSLVSPYKVWRKCINA